MPHTEITHSRTLTHPVKVRDRVSSRWLCLHGRRFKWTSELSWLRTCLLVRQWNASPSYQKISIICRRFPEVCSEQSVTLWHKQVNCCSRNVRNPIHCLREVDFHSEYAGAPGSLEQVVRLPVGSLIERVVKHVTLPVEVSFHLRKHDPIRTSVMNCRKSCQLPGLICSHGLHSSDQSPHRAGAEAVGESPSLLAAAEFSLHCGAAKIQFSLHPGATSAFSNTNFCLCSRKTSFWKKKYPPSPKINQLSLALALTIHNKQPSPQFCCLVLVSSANLLMILFII